MKSVLLDVFQFEIPQTGEAFYSMFLDSIKAWNMEKLVHSIITDNAADIFNGVELLCVHPYILFSMEVHSPCE